MLPSKGYLSILSRPRCLKRNVSMPEMLFWCVWYPRINLTLRTKSPMTNLNRILGQTDNTDSTIKACDLVKQIKVIHAIHMVSEAWKKVKQDTIRNCFDKAFNSKDNNP